MVFQGPEMPRDSKQFMKLYRDWFKRPNGAVDRARRRDGSLDLVELVRCLLLAGRHAHHQCDHLPPLCSASGAEFMRCAQKPIAELLQRRAKVAVLQKLRSGVVQWSNLIAELRRSRRS
ncbi:hypothetical protein RPC_3845 [Rhodopseudomonas palustris BisB18]|uniref:Uncharacterized protein n=1 Tax=Rhodopseudomonas palustris (strain BisB18) TaxID=316056 RepID=Q20ZQ8_RHOPB